MNITINNQSHNVQDTATLQDIVLLITGHKQKGLAVAVNNHVISRQKYACHVLKPGDSIIIIKATQGG